MSFWKACFRLYALVVGTEPNAVRLGIGGFGGSWYPPSAASSKCGIFETRDYVNTALS